MLTYSHDGIYKRMWRQKREFNFENNRASRMVMQKFNAEYNLLMEGDSEHQ